MASMQVERVQKEQSHYQEQHHKDEEIQAIGSACGCQEKLSMKEKQSADREVVKEHKGCGEQIKEFAAKANEVLHEIMEHKDSAQLVAGKKHDGQSVQQQQLCAKESNHGASLQGYTAVRKEEGAFSYYHGEQHKLQEVVQKKQDGSCCKAVQQQHEVEDQGHAQPKAHHKDHSGGVVGSVQIEKSEVKCKEDQQSEKCKDKKVISEKKQSKKTACELKEDKNLQKEIKCSSKTEKKEKKKKKEEKVGKKKSESKDKDSSSSSSDSSSESEGEGQKEKKKKNDKKRC